MIEMEKEISLKQKEELYFKLLENYSYEKITTNDMGMPGSGLDSQFGVSGFLVQACVF